MANGKRKTGKGPKQVAALKHDEARRKNIPTAEMQSLAEKVEEMRPRAPAHYPRATPLANGETRARDGDLDPQLIWNGARIRLTNEQIRALEENGQIEIGEAQLVWRGKDTQDWSDLVVQVPPLYIQEKIHPKVIIDDLIRRTKEKAKEQSDAPNLFADFNGLDPEARLEFYSHDQHWSNRMILGDSLQVMARRACERHDASVLKHLNRALDVTYNAAQTFYLLNSGHGQSRTDVSTFFQRRHLDREFEKFWRQGKNRRRGRFGAAWSRFAAAIETEVAQ
jgi:hypothetical protein